MDDVMALELKASPERRRGMGSAGRIFENFKDI